MNQFPLIPDSAYSGWSLTASDGVKGTILHSVEVWPDQLQPTLELWREYARQNRTGGHGGSWANLVIEIIPIDLTVTGRSEAGARPNTELSLTINRGRGLIAAIKSKLQELRK